jgi:hypothetical protein
MRGGDDTGEEHKEGTRSGAGEGGRPGIESRSPRARAWRGTARRVQLGRWAAEEAMPVGPGGMRGMLLHPALMAAAANWRARLCPRREVGEA